MFHSRRCRFVATGREHRFTFKVHVGESSDRFDVDQVRLGQINRDIPLVLGVVKDVLPSRLHGVQIEQFLHRCGPGLDSVYPSGKHHLAELLDSRIVRSGSLQHRHGIAHEEPQLACEWERDAPCRREADSHPRLVVRSAHQTDRRIRCDEGASVEWNECPGAGRKVGRQFDRGLNCVLEVGQVGESHRRHTGLGGLIPDSILLLRRRVESEIVTDPRTDILATTGTHLQSDHYRAEMLGRPPGIRPAHALQCRVAGEGPPVLFGGRKLAVGEAPDNTEGLALYLAQRLLERIRLIELNDRVEVVLRSHVLHARRVWLPGAVERYDPDALLARRETSKVPLRHIVMQLRRVLLASHVRTISPVAPESPSLI